MKRVFSISIFTVATILFLTVITSSITTINASAYNALEVDTSDSDGSELQSQTQSQSLTDLGIPTGTSSDKTTQVIQDASTKNPGSEETMKKKLYYRALKSCALTPGAYTYGKVHGLVIPEYAILATSFTDGPFGSTAMADRSARYHSKYTVKAGALLESELAQEGYDDGKLYCGENNNKLFTTAIGQLSIYKNDLFCNKDDNHVKGGILKRYSGTDRSCLEMINNPNKGGVVRSGADEFQIAISGKDYYNNLVKERAFKDDVPSGSLTGFTNLEKYYLYYNTLVTACTSGNPIFGNKSLGFSVMMYNESTNKVEQAGFNAKNSNSKSESIYLYSTWSGNSDGAGEKMTCSEIASKISDKDQGPVKAYINNLDNGGTPATGTSSANSDDSASSDDSSSDDCFSNGGAISWIMCPLVSAATETLNAAYEWLEKHFLQLPADELLDRGSNTYSAWQAFLSIANVCFVILFLVVIVSQLTGVGINNYGIKKILPRLIIVAVLVNVSYIICQLAIDISNILGYSIKGFFNNLSGVATSSSGSSASTAQNVVTFGGVTAIALAAFFISPGLIATALVAILGCVISVLFLIAILLAREVGVVLGVVIAPLAIVCYMLPNTNQYFKKWVDLMKGLLLVYPLCSLVMGGSAFIANIIGGLSSSTDDPAMAIAAMGIRVLPFFAVPSLLKGSLKVLGETGKTLSSLGKRASHGTTSRIKNSKNYQDLQAASNARRRSFTAGVKRVKNEDGTYSYKTRKGLFGARRAIAQKTGIGAAEVNRAQSDYINARTQRDTARRNLSNTKLGAISSSIADKEFQEDVNNMATLISSGGYNGLNSTDNSGLANALSEEMRNNGWSATAQALFQQLEANGDKGLDAIAEIKKDENGNDWSILDDSSISETAKRQLFTNITKNGRNKASNPTLFKTAGAKLDKMNSGGKSNDVSYIHDFKTGAKYDGLGVNDIRGLSDQEFDNFLQHIKDNPKGAASSIATEALSSPNANLKGNQSERIKKALEKDPTKLSLDDIRKREEEEGRKWGLTGPQYAEMISDGYDPVKNLDDFNQNVRQYGGNPYNPPSST